jgi:hypothetical protein
MVPGGAQTNNLVFFLGVAAAFGSFGFRMALVVSPYTVVALPIGNAVRIHWNVFKKSFKLQRFMFLLGKIFNFTFTLNKIFSYLDKVTFFYQRTVAGASGANFEVFLASRAAEARQFTERGILGNIQTVGPVPATTQVAYPTPGARPATRLGFGQHFVYGVKLEYHILHVVPQFIELRLCVVFYRRFLGPPYHFIPIFGVFTHQIPNPREFCLKIRARPVRHRLIIRQKRIIRLEQPIYIP